ncbi:MULTISPECIES: ACP S-malonyltransferase [Ureibacillus]|jgi:[acyl-carrier-protein] S-malonyltransferase|uniref:Malonyl CoA-acyl carrier protein transacylase n=1 Tax=Ureibacillus thermosphaericus TaxID=51173 RepID=A0A840Q099_URETH|nr:ACP S-malonyltransferase [Ureibacillus thermosphaericus]MBB5149898.1 [acyl-carrier-protein] S-malonyltransferase [Ureibacillus thermosphaericus]NKZ30942.1 ACP S-malonyltransferase [Ureibacillus thermosphaericus]
MSKIAFIFPGQGSQKVGMGAEFVANDEASKAFYDQADQALNIKLSTLMLEGPQEELTLTYHAQPALLTTGVMIASKLMEAGITPDYTAGHSLGEYGSFVIAGSLSFEEAVKIVHKRGLYMNEAVPAGQGAMAAILGMDEEPLKEVCAEITNNGDLVQLANLNCPGQIVISGTKAGVEKASQLAKEKGAKRAIPLDVSGPFHSELMKDAAIKLEKEIEQVEISQPNIPIISNVHAGILEDVESIKKEMVEQVYSPVQWERDVRKMLECGVTTFIECGPGKVLSGLVKKIDRSVKTYCVYDIATFEEVVKELKG